MIERSENITNAWNDMWSDNVQTAKDANAEIIANTGAAVDEINDCDCEDDKPAATTTAAERATTTTAATQDGMGRYGDPLFGQSTLGQYLFGKDRFGVTPTPAIGAAPTQEVAAGGKKKQEIIFTQMRDSLKEIEQEMTR